MIFFEISYSTCLVSHSGNEKHILVLPHWPQHVQYWKHWAPCKLLVFELLPEWSIVRRCPMIDRSAVEYGHFIESPELRPSFFRHISTAFMSLIPDRFDLGPPQPVETDRQATIDFVQILRKGNDKNVSVMSGCLGGAR